MSLNYRTHDNICPLTAGEVRSYTPDLPYESDKPPVYHYKVPTVMDRNFFNRDVGYMKLRYPSDQEMNRACHRAIDRVVVQSDQGICHDALDKFIEDKTDEKLGADIEELEAKLAREDTTYAMMLQDRRTYMSVVPLLACQHFLTGWDNVDHKFHQVNGKISDDLLSRLSEIDLRLTGWAILGMVSPDPATEKNSVSPPISRRDRRASKAVKKRATARNSRSAKTSSKPTRASQSRKKSPSS